MPRRHVTADGNGYTIAADDPSRVALRTWALLTARVVDELTLLPPVPPVTVELRMPGFTTRSTDGGVVGLVGRPWRVLAPLLTDTRSVDFTVRADEYLPAPVTAALRTQRRLLTAPAPADVLSLSSTAQLAPGLGVLVQREASADIDEWNAIAALGPGPNQVTLRAPLRVARSIGRAVAPDMFLPTRLPDIALHRAHPARIRGRLIEAPSLAAPRGAPAAELAVTGLWWDRPSVATQPPRPPSLVVVDPPLYAVRAALTATVERCGLSPAGPLRLLEHPAPAGTDRIVVSHRNGLSLGGGELLRLETAATAEVEWIPTVSVDGSAPPGFPAAVQLRAPTAYAHRAGAPVQRMSILATAPVAQLERDGVPGDQTVFLDTTAGLGNGAIVRISGGAALPEFHRVRVLPSTPDLVNFVDQPAIAPDGAFELPPLGRIAQLTILARLTGYPDVIVDCVPDYTGGNDLTIVFTT
jgi:hypothetical protein